MADRATVESDSNETIGEAPSIEDDFGKVQGTAVKSSKISAKTGRASSTEPMKSVAEDITTIKTVESRLHDEVKKGSEVGKVLLESGNENKRPEKIMKISHFQAMALMGRVLFGKLKLPVPTKSSGNSSCSADSYSSEEVESETPSEESNKTSSVESSVDYTPVDEIQNDAEKIDIDLDDPDVAASATKIQASFRGKKARDEVSQMKKDKQEEPTKVVEDDIDIDLDDPDVAASATKIQASFRGKKAREEVSQMKKDKQEEPSKVVEEEIDIDLDDPDVAASATKIQASFRGKKAREEVTQMRAEKQENPKDNIEEEIDIDLDDPDVAVSATKIQASFRGKKAREEVSQMKKEKQEQPTKVVEEEIDIDLDDPEVAESATKIQASFRGKKARDEVTQMRAEKQENTKEDIEEEIDIDLNDPDVAASATKIQASFRGKKAREEVNKIKEEKGTTDTTNDVEEEIDIDPGVAKSGAKIQAEFNEEIKDGAQKEEDTPTVEEIDIDLNDPDVAKSATKIQAGFRGKRAREEVEKMKLEKDASDEAEVDPENKTEIVEVEEEIDIDLDDPDVAKSATKIQAGFRGKKARSEVAKMKKEIEVEEIKDEQITTEPVTAEEEIDIDLNDPDVAKSATKIQAGFRGKKARQEVIKMKESKHDTPGESRTNSDTLQTAEETIGVLEKGESGKDVDRDKESSKGNTKKKKSRSIDWEDPEIDKAATAIQAGFKGMKVREEMKQKECQLNKSEGNCVIVCCFRTFFFRELVSSKC